MALFLRAPPSRRASAIAIAIAIASSSLCRAFIPPSNLHDSRRPAAACLQATARPHSRPRGPLWRGKKGIGKEALHVLCDVKRAKQDSARLGNVLQLKAARLLKTDLLAVLRELQRQHEVELALKIFQMVRKEVWYKPDTYFYKDMLCCLARNKRVSECETILRDMKTEGLPPDSLCLTEVMTAYLQCGMLPQAMETFDQMRRGIVPPDLPAFKVLLRYLKKMGKRELRAKIKKEYLEFYEGIVDDKEKYREEESDAEDGGSDVESQETSDDAETDESD